MEKPKKIIANYNIGNKIICATLNVLIVLIFFQSNVNAINRWNRKNRYGNNYTVGLEGNLYQLKMKDYSNSTEQKFLESAMRLNMGKYFSNGFKMEVSFMKGLNNVGPLFNNAESSLQYIRIYDTRIVTITGSYDYYLSENFFLSPKLGFGRMDYKERYDGNLTEHFNQNSISELLTIGLDYHYKISTNATIHLGADYVFGRSHIKFPVTSLGIKYFIPSTTLKRIARNCPTFF